jgi:hypothetical protein
VITTVLLVLGGWDFAWAGYILAAIAILAGVVPRPGA